MIDSNLEKFKYLEHSNY